MKKKELSILIRIYLYVTALCIMAIIISNENFLRTSGSKQVAYTTATHEMIQAFIFGTVYGVHLATLIFGIYSAAKYYYDRSI